MKGHKKSYQASFMCGIWSDSDDHLTTDPRTFLYSILYSKKAAVEAYTPPTHCPTAPYLYSIYTASIQQLYRLYSYTAIQQLYSIHPLQHPSVVWFTSTRCLLVGAGVRSQSM